METVELDCEKRETRTKGDVRALRRNGRVPAILYGPRRQTVALAVSGAELATRVALAARQRLIRLKSPSPDLDQKHVIIKEIQRASISGAILHADLYEVDLSERIKVSVPLHFTGKALGVANEGGILQPLVRQVEVECLPLEIPESIEVDVTRLGIHDAIHVSELTFGANVRPIFDTDYAVVSVLPPTVEAVPVAAPAVAEAVPAEGAAAPAAAPAAAAPAEAGAKEAAAPAPAGKKAEAGKK